MILEKQNKRKRNLTNKFKKMKNANQSQKIFFEEHEKERKHIHKWHGFTEFEFQMGLKKYLGVLQRGFILHQDVFRQQTLYPHFQTKPALHQFNSNFGGK